MKFYIVRILTNSDFKAYYLNNILAVSADLNDFLSYLNENSSWLAPLLSRCYLKRFILSLFPEFSKSIFRYDWNSTVQYFSQILLRIKFDISYLIYCLKFILTDSFDGTVILIDSSWRYNWLINDPRHSCLLLIFLLNFQELSYFPSINKHEWVVHTQYFVFYL